MLPSLRVDVLGTPILTMDGQPLRVDTRKAGALLAVLVTATADGQSPVSREQLAAMFWPEADDARARGSLRRTLSVLVTATGAAVRADRTALSLNTDLVSSDVIRFAELRAADRIEDWEQAAALLRGDFLSGFSLRDCGPFEDWAAARAQALRRDAGALMERLVRARLRSGELHAALAAAVRWLALDPLHEPAHRSVMRLLAWTGRRQDAMDAYHRCVRVLADELGVAPVRATTAVYEAIRTGTLAARQQPVQQAQQTPSLTAGPARVAKPPGDPQVRRDHIRGAQEMPLIARRQELDALLGLVGSTGRVAVVTGESGVGRSRLLQEFSGSLTRVAAARAHEGEAGLAFAPVADLLREALPYVGDDLSVAVRREVSRIVPEYLSADTGAPALPGLDQLGGPDRFFDAVVRALAAAELDAVVLDDVHAVSAAAADFLSYLLYRLDRLGCLLVLSWRTPGLAARHPVRLALATGRPGERATHLPLTRLTRADVAELVAATGSPLDVDALLDATSGLPLVLIEAVRAGRVDVLGAGVRELLATRLGGVSEETMQVLSALAVCGGVADQQTLRVTSGRGELETVEAIEQALLLGLIDEEGPAVAFSHDALRRVAYEGLSLVRRRLLHARAAEALTAPEPEVNPGLIAHHWHLAGRDELAAQWAWTAASRAVGLFAHEEALLHLQFALALGQDRCEVAVAEGGALLALGRYEAALVAYARASSLAPVADLPLRARIERHRADVHARVGDWDLADTGLASALELLAGRPGTQSQQALLLADRALVALRSGRPDPQGYAEAALVVAGDVAGDLGHVQNVAGLVAFAQSRRDDAHAAFSAALLAAADDDALRAAILNNLARAQSQDGDWAAAVLTAQRALELAELRGDRHRLAALHSNLADRLHEAGDPDGAMGQMKLAAALFAEVGSDPLRHPDVWTLTAW